MNSSQIIKNQGTSLGTRNATGRLSKADELNQILKEMGWNPTDEDLLQINKRMSKLTY